MWQSKQYETKCSFYKYNKVGYTRYANIPKGSSGVGRQTTVWLSSSLRYWNDRLIIVSESWSQNWSNKYLFWRISAYQTFLPPTSSFLQTVSMVNTAAVKQSSWPITWHHSRNVAQLCWATKLSDKNRTCDMENRSTFVAQHCWGLQISDIAYIWKHGSPWTTWWQSLVMIVRMTSEIKRRKKMIVRILFSPCVAIC